MALRYNYARELRTIGQQLDKHGIDIFDLRHDDGDYSLECADPNPPYLGLIKLRYSAFDVRSLDLAAAQARTKEFLRVDFQSLAESLRAVGRDLEKLDANLLRISVQDSPTVGSVLRIEYEARNGGYRSEERPLADLAELAMHMYKERSRVKGGFSERGTEH